MRGGSIVAAALVVLVAATAGRAATRTDAPSGGAEPIPPLRMAFYYPWFPEQWHQRDLVPEFTHFRPSLGYYDSSDAAVIRRHVAAMRWGRIDAAIYSWWGRETPTDLRLPRYLAVGQAQKFRFAVYHEPEGYADPSVAEIRADLLYIQDSYASSAAYLRIDSRFVVFVYGDAWDGVSCGVADRWKRASAGIDAYVVLKAFRGFRQCASQPDGWHTYLAEKYEFSLAPYAYSVTPGFYFAPERLPRRVRSLARWRRSVQNMVRSGATFQLVLSFNEWGEGTAVESAREWASRSGYGRYLDVLHSIR